MRTFRILIAAWSLLVGILIASAVASSSASLAAILETLAMGAR